MNDKRFDNDRPAARGELRGDVARERSAAESRDAPHRDPVTGAAGFHPVGTGIGAAAGGVAAGAAVGSVAGPVGTVIGAAVGALAGGLVGKGIAEQIDPSVEDAYWRDNFLERDYIDDPGEARYDDYGPAYRYGVDAYGRNAGRDYDDVEPELAAGWDKARGTSRLHWDDAKHATRDAWHRLKDGTERAIPGDADGDGR
jgi:hypothetical protein